MPRRVTFVAVTPTQVELWSEIVRAARFASSSLEASILLAGSDPARLDQLAARLMPAVARTSLPPATRAPRPGFGARLAARFAMLVDRAVAGALDALGTGTLVVGNDSGYVERLAVRAARRRGAASLLVQDGLFPRRPPSALRDLFDRALTAAGVPHLASGRYGHGGCDAVAVMGARWQERLASEGVDPARIHVVGNPLYERSPGESPLPSAPGPVFTYFTTSILTELGDATAHAQQLAEIRALAALLRRRHGPDHRLIVKLHPLDRPADHHALADDGALLRAEGDPAALIAASDVVFTSFSAIALEAPLRHRVCLIPARFLAASPWMDVVRGLGLPLVESEDALDRALAELDTPDGRAARLAEARARVGGLVSPSGRAAERCAALIDEMGSRCASS